MRHLRSLVDLRIDEFQTIMDWSHQLKKHLSQGHRPDLLKNRTCALVFEKASLRTRVSFETAMAQLGGTALYLTGDAGWRERETIGDFVRVLGEYCDFLVCRAFSQTTIEELVRHNAVPIINGLTDDSHPCQALADVMTIDESTGGNLRGKQLTFVGDGNNVVRSLIRAAAMSGLRFRLACPEKYQIPNGFLDEVRKVGKLDFDQSDDIRSMIKDADFIYTDVWTSMGQEEENEARKAAFGPYQVNTKLMGMAPDRCKVLHCLPARRGMEITDAVIDSKNSLVFEQAGNRLHAQKGLLIWLAIENGYTTAADVRGML
ncbi:MAG: ornithine carbamoyltransferase [Planctomycetota bacterium]|nr:ornithine carbamoyltransferase [Planctomycetota bacterium]